MDRIIVAHTPHRRIFSWILAKENEKEEEEEEDKGLSREEK